MDHDEMVCKASAGVSTPEIGARLQMDSGLSGESIRTKETLRCDDTKTDGRVNQQSCEELGIASVVIMPILEGEDVIGVFELFSNHPHAFQDRDITALERMGFMVRTALAQAESAEMGLQKRNTDVNATKRDEPRSEEEEEEEEAGTPPQTAASLEESELIAEIRRFARDKGLTVAAKNDGSAEAAKTERAKISFHIPGSTARKGEAAAAPNPASEERTSPIAEATNAVWAEPVVKQVSEDAASRPATVTSDASDVPVTEPQKIIAIVRESEIVQNAEQVKRAEGGEGREAVSATASETAKADAPAPGAVEMASTSQDQKASEKTEAVSSAADTPEVASADKEPTLKSLVDTASSLMETSRGAAPPTARSVEKARTAVAGLGRCGVCGFPVSEGRKICLDCEKKKPTEQATTNATETVHSAVKSSAENADTEQESAASEQPAKQLESVPDAPQFLMNSSAEGESWIASHKFAVVAIAVIVLGVLVFVLSR